MSIALPDHPGPIDDDTTRRKHLSRASLALRTACGTATADPAPGR